MWQRRQGEDWGDLGVCKGDGGRVEGGGGGEPVNKETRIVFEKQRRGVKGFTPPPSC